MKRDRIGSIGIDDIINKRSRNNEAPVEVKEQEYAETLKYDLLKKAYSKYSETYMKVNKTGNVPTPLTVDELKRKVMPFVGPALDELHPDIYDILPSLAGTAGAVIYGPHGQIAGEIGGQVFSNFLKWGIEENGFNLIVDFVKDTMEEIKDVISDVGTSFEDIFSEVGSILKF